MACYHPLIASPTGEIGKNGKPKLRVQKIEKREDVLKLTIKDGFSLIPCGHCIGCRLDYSRRWADRMMLELETAKKAVFITLTYNDLNAHWTEVRNKYTAPCGKIIVTEGETTLDKRDAQLWMKRLRKEFGDYRIRYYLSGEYGDENRRAHMHCICFGISLSDIGDCDFYKRSKLGDNYYTSKRIWKTWRKGFVVVTEVNYKTCAYTARYVTKKLSGPLKEDYARRNCIPEFALMSRMPGLGLEYLELHPDSLDFEYINISTKEEGKKIPIPKYFVDRLGYDSENNILFNPVKHDIMIEQRKEFANDANLLRMKRTDLLFMNYKEVEEMNKIEKLKTLKRDKVR